MPKTRINCPNCHQPIMAEVEQLFDVYVDPSAKQKLLSGAINLIQCPFCGYRGNLATPIVYHDPDKELLLTFIPPEVGLARDEQERIIGSMINRVIDNLPQEKRKGYLLQPKAHLTMQNLLEHILQADGITHEMIEAQQQRLNLLQRLLAITDREARKEVIKQEEESLDADFFNLLGRLLEASRLSKDQDSSNKLEDLQVDLFEITEFGKQVKEQTEEVQAAIKSLQDAGKELTRDKLVDIVVNAPSDTRLKALVSLVRPGMDNIFFKKLSDRIDRARDKGRQRLIELREKLLELTSQYDAQMSARMQSLKELLDDILQADDIATATRENLPAIDEMFLQLLNDEMEVASQNNDEARVEKLQQIVEVLNQAGSAPPEVALIEDLLAAPSDEARRQMMEEHKEEITPQLLEMLTGLVAQVQQSDGDQELLDRLKAVNRQVIRFSMKAKLKGG
jgi:hypothetical protein